MSRSRRTEAAVDLPMDVRLSSFINVTPEALDAAAATWPRAAATPPEVTRLLDRAAIQFRTGAATYDDFTAAFFTALQAAELALRLRLGADAPRRATFGGLIRRAKEKSLLEGDLLAWLETFALRFRNRLAHPGEPLVLPPGTAHDCIRSTFEAVVHLCPGDNP